MPTNEAGSTEDAVFPNSCSQPPAAGRPLIVPAVVPKIQLPPALATPALVAVQVSSSQLALAERLCIPKWR